MSWSGNVLGGVAAPRFYLLSDDLVTNGSMEDDDDADSIPDSWTAQGGATLLQVNDTSTMFGDYVLSIDDADPSGWDYAKQTGMSIPSAVGGDINGKDILVVFWVKQISGTNPEMFVNIYDSNNNLAGTTDVFTTLKTDRYLQFWAYISNLVTAAGDDEFGIGIFPTGLTVGDLGKIYVDNVQVFEVTQLIDLPLPNEWRGQGWTKELQARQRLIDGTMKEYIDGWRFRANMNWEYMSTSDEILRQNLADHAGLIGFQPHNDVEWGQVCTWDGDLERSYFFNRFLGHSSNIPLLGCELMDRKPEDT